ncbi:hypothetical protein CH330_06980 [candidate division WOR-3 bacterium JGI_Cruoil_03_51_56]|uniref:HD/PDEase domain-containing protein n=1 Tax=candidate division WOR-3 bacterium JGI_Cruoil_03_51_56 TaxID=1973747 RepID=A0A235BRW2_UNCW3|nr:MAG: hypothetical protein CH330_06980 [candidate division WOR-3 bacterium JGI_Cruoil_03_51_56]
MSDIEAVLSKLGQERTRLSRIAGKRRLYLVGGTIRDILLERNPADFDFAVAGSGVEFAKEFCRKTKSKLVVLSTEDDEARVVCHKHIFDFNGLGDQTIQQDLKRRDFTINALACEIFPDRIGEILDFCEGRKDLAERIIRPVSAGSLKADPLRLLRAMRLALELGLKVAESVYAQGSSISLGRTAAERIGKELLRIMEASGSYKFLVRLYGLEKLHEILPDFVPVLEDKKLHHHMFQTYYKIEEIIAGESFFSRFEPEWRRYFDRWAALGPEANGLPYRRALLKFSGLLHDIAKPQTRFVNSKGEVHFYGHDSLGAKIVGTMLRERLRLSGAQIKMVQAQVKGHMRLHLLATNRDLTDRAIRRFFRDSEEEAFGLMILCYADGWATAGRTSHLVDTITRMIEQKRAEDAQLKVRHFINGYDLIGFGLKPGPAFKVILQELEDLQVEGKINSKEEGIEYLKTNLPGLKQKEGD